MTTAQVNEVYEDLKAGLKALKTLSTQGFYNEINDSSITGIDTFRMSLKFEDIIQSIDESGTITFNEYE